MYPPLYVYPPGGSANPPLRYTKHYASLLSPPQALFIVQATEVSLLYLPIEPILLNVRNRRIRGDHIPPTRNELRNNVSVANSFRAVRIKGRFARIEISFLYLGPPKSGISLVETSARKSRRLRGGLFPPVGDVARSSAIFAIVVSTCAFFFCKRIVFPDAQPAFATASGKEYKRVTIITPSSGNVEKRTSQSPH